MQDSLQDSLLLPSINQNNRRTMDRNYSPNSGNNMWLLSSQISISLNSAGVTVHICGLHCDVALPHLCHILSSSSLSFFPNIEGPGPLNLFIQSWLQWTQLCYAVLPIQIQMNTQFLRSSWLAHVYTSEATTLMSNSQNPPIPPNPHKTGNIIHHFRHVRLLNSEQTTYVKTASVCSVMSAVFFILLKWTSVSLYK